MSVLSRSTFSSHLLMQRRRMVMESQHLTQAHVGSKSDTPSLSVDAQTTDIGKRREERREVTVAFQVVY